MRHGRKINHLGRTSAHRNAMLSNMAASLIMHKRIYTTLAKAKALRVFIEPLLTRSKTDSTHSRRMVFAALQDKAAVTELFRVISQKIENRNGGYTRILKTGTRLGDNASMAMIELVDFNEAMLGIKKEEKKVKSTRRSRSKKSDNTKKEVVNEQPQTENKVVADETKETPKADTEKKTSAKKGTKKTEE